MQKEEYLARLEELYTEYLKTVQELENNRKFGEGMFGFKGGPADNPCHGRFAEDIRMLAQDYAAQQPESEAAREFMCFVFDASQHFSVPRTAKWMLVAVHGLTAPLAAALTPEDAKALYKIYSARYKRWERLPNQDELLKCIKKRM